MTKTRCSIIMTCKGRLEHLKRTLPYAISQQPSEVLVVDYDCPDGTSAWVKENYPAVRVIKVDSAPQFQQANARNVGAAAASGNWLFFVDADILMAEGLFPNLAPTLVTGCFYRPFPAAKQNWGTVLVSRADFDHLGGYDEVIKGYGAEDDDLYLSLALLGVRQIGYPAEWLSEIPHDNDMRVRFCDVPNMLTSQRANGLYVAAKADAWRLLGRPLNQDERQVLFNEAWRAVNAAGDAGEGLLEVTMPVESSIPVQQGWHLQRRLVFTLSPVIDILTAIP